MRPAGSAAASRPNQKPDQRASSALCDQIRQAIARQLAGGIRPEDLVLPGPGGSNGIPRGARAPLSTNNLRRVYKAAVQAAGADLGHWTYAAP
jgi:hypothetical protein